MLPDTDTTDLSAAHREALEILHAGEPLPVNLHILLSQEGIDPEALTEEVWNG